MGKSTSKKAKDPVSNSHYSNFYEKRDCVIPKVAMDFLGFASFILTLSYVALQNWNVWHFFRGKMEI